MNNKVKQLIDPVNKLVVTKGEGLGGRRNR